MASISSRSREQNWTLCQVGNRDHAARTRSLRGHGVDGWTG